MLVIPVIRVIPLTLVTLVGSLPCSERFFSGYSGFPLSSKTNISKFQFDQESGRQRTTMWMCYLQFVIYLFYLFIYVPVVPVVLVVLAALVVPLTLIIPVVSSLAAHPSTLVIAVIPVTQIISVISVILVNPVIQHPPLINSFVFNKLS